MKMIIDRSKVRRERKAKRAILREESQIVNFRSLYFDGRKDKTLHNEKRGDTYYRSIIIEEHITVLNEPGSNYVGHTVPVTGRSSDIANSLIELLWKNKIVFDNLAVIGCDGTVVNTGAKRGVIRRVEENIGCPLQWFICLLHFNELPLRHLFIHLDGKTTGPHGYKGHIGKQLENCHILPTVEFEPVDNNLPTMSHHEVELSSDQQYLLKIVLAITEGDIEKSLAKITPGKMSHARG
jgi:hypothetical protein